MGSYKMKAKPKAPQACDQAGKWFEHIQSQECLVFPDKNVSNDKSVLPPIFSHRNRRNYRNSNLFSQFDNRWDHEKRKKIVTELTHRHNYESPEMLVRIITYNLYDIKKMIFIKLKTQ